MDWIVHLLVPWIGAKILQIRYSGFSDRRIALVMLGAVLPDVGAVGYLFQWAGFNYGGALLPFHTLIGSVLVAALASMVFARKAQAFSFLAIGFASHYALDSLLMHASGGMVLLFPFSWDSGFQFEIVPTNSWVPVIITVAAAVLLFAALRVKNRAKRRNA